MPVLQQKRRTSRTMEGAHAETAAKIKKGKTMWPGGRGEFLRYFDKDSTAFILLSLQQRMIYASQDQRNEFWAECYSVSGVCTPLLGTVTMNEKTKKDLPYACTHVLKAGQTEQVCLPRVRE